MTNGGFGLVLDGSEVSSDIMSQSEIVNFCRKSQSARFRSLKLVKRQHSFCMKIGIMNLKINFSQMNTNMK